MKFKNLIFTTNVTNYLANEFGKDNVTEAKKRIVKFINGQRISTVNELKNNKSILIRYIGNLHNVSPLFEVKQPNAKNVVSIKVINYGDDNIITFN